MIPEAYSESYQKSKMECFEKLVNVKKLLTVFAKRFILMFYRILIRFWMLEPIFSPINHISKPRTLMEKKVRVDHAPSFFFFAKPAAPPLISYSLGKTLWGWLKRRDLEVSYCKRSLIKRWREYF